MPRVKPEQRKVADNPISKNIDRIMKTYPDVNQPNGYYKNLKIIGKRAGIAPPTLRNYIAGDRVPSEKQLKKLAAALLIDVEDFLIDPDLPPGEQRNLKMKMTIKKSIDGIENKRCLILIKQIIETFASHDENNDH